MITRNFKSFKGILRFDSYFGNRSKKNISNKIKQFCLKEDNEIIKLSSIKEMKIKKISIFFNLYNS